MSDQDAPLGKRDIWAITTQISRFKSFSLATNSTDIYDSTEPFFPNRQGLSATSEYANENGFRLNVTQIYEVDTFEEVRHNLTEQQYEALTTAIERGYYNIPREANASELATMLDIPHQALFKRFRQATKISP